MQKLHPEISQLIQLLAGVAENRKSLPGFAYVSEAVQSLEKVNIFHGDWVFACAEQEVAEAGAYYTFNLHGESITIIRGKDGQLRALSNICRHRGTPPLDPGSGVTKRLVCPYHAWTYDDRGALVAVPHPGNAKIEKSENCLPQFNLEIWNGLVFISLNPKVEALAKRLAGLDECLKEFDLKQFVYYQTEDQEEWQANWKLIMENAAESYHLFKVHKETLETVTPTKQASYLQGSSE
jgi:phenylpropionate dioxygenase-like ring-hydroxylating dioxygenase large terminal subunit